MWRKTERRIEERRLQDKTSHVFYCFCVCKYEFLYFTRNVKGGAYYANKDATIYIEKIPYRKNFFFKVLHQRTDGRVWEFCSKRRSVGRGNFAFSSTFILHKQGCHNLYRKNHVPIENFWKFLHQMTDARVWKFCSKRRSVGREQLRCRVKGQMTLGSMWGGGGVKKYPVQITNVANQQKLQINKLKLRVTQITNHQQKKKCKKKNVFTIINKRTFNLGRGRGKFILPQVPILDFVLQKNIPKTIFLTLLFYFFQDLFKVFFPCKMFFEI